MAAAESEGRVCFKAGRGRARARPPLFARQPRQEVSPHEANAQEQGLIDPSAVIVPLCPLLLPLFKEHRYSDLSLHVELL